MAIVDMPDRLAQGLVMFIVQGMKKFSFIS